ncbi:nonsense-mediated mRNA decay factor SMG7-like [Henckelia pumila]|uniref:nonsense-mediated mRNA decay factor SMG7-like n=1 Tax=Henckelia pumila TaxID=405737 RepID=UPI003C6E92E6
MMTIPMDNNKESSSREGVQRLFNKNIELDKKRRKAAEAKIPSDPNTWQQMRENYEAIILEDHAFSEQHDIEYSLWQLHYRRIEELRALFSAALASAGSTSSLNGKVQVRVGPDRLTKIRSQVKTFLSEATGFYHDLMLKIRSKYGMPLGYFSDDPDNQMTMSKDGNKFSEVKKGLISCHRCLIYLGDLARYKGLYGEGDSKARDFIAASSYYIQASLLWPSSGNPQHQLAILAGYANDELLSIYRYFRSLAADNPFVTARDNLIIAFEKNRQNYNQLLGNSKAALEKTAPSKMPGKGRGKGETRRNFKDNMAATSSVKERASNNFELFKAFITRFIRLNGILFTRTSLETFAEVFSVVKNDFIELLSSGPNEEFSFGADVNECILIIVRLVVILIFSVHNLSKENENQSYADILQRSVLLQNAYTATFEFMGCVLERCHQLNDPLSSYLMPGIMVFVEWLASHQDVAICSELEEKPVTVRSFFWKKCISLLNKLLSSEYMLGNEDRDETCFSNMSKYDESETTNRLALPEDFELKGFLPLIPAQTILDFSRKNSIGDDVGIKGKVARAQRIIAAVKAIAGVVRSGHDGFFFDMKSKKFVIGVEPQILDDYLHQMPLESESNGSTLDNSLEGQMVLCAVPKLEDSIQDDDEEEVIVFKPSTLEKNLDGFSSKFNSSEGLAPVGGAGTIDFRNENVSSYVGHDGFLLQNGTSTIMKPSTTFPSGTSQYLQPVPPSTKWLVAQDQMVNALAHLHLMENENSCNSELVEGQFGVSQSAALSVPYPKFVSAVTSHNYPPQISQAALRSKLDSIFSSGIDTNSMAVKQPSVSSAVQKKMSVSRPVRHLGPPPGFGSAPSKVVDEPVNMAVRNESPPSTQMDDYSWLDGYQLPLSNHKAGFSNSINEVGPTVNSVGKNNSMIGIANFQVQHENQNGHRDYQFSETLKALAEQQQQFQKGSQQARPPQQYQGQSLWDGRFFV